MLKPQSRGCRQDSNRRRGTDGLSARERTVDLGGEPDGCPPNGGDGGDGFGTGRGGNADDVIRGGVGDGRKGADPRSWR